MNSDPIINPFILLGVDPHKPDMKLLKKNFYNLVLVCHPDRGGSEKSMRIVRNAYDYVKSQFQNCENRESLSARRKKIHIDNNVKKNYNKDKFNRAFEINKKNTINNFDRGYGNYMTSSDYAKGKLSYDKKDIHKEQEHVFKNIDNNTLMLYKEPKSYVDAYGNHERFDIKKISDFSYSTDSLHMSDYKNAFKIIGENNIKKVKIKKRDYKSYIKQRSMDKQTYVMYNDDNSTSTEEESSYETSNEESSYEID